MIPVTLTPQARVSRCFYLCMLTTLRISQELYDAVEELTQERVGSLLQRHGSIHAAAVQSNVLSLLTRMRQLALHPGLLPTNYLEQLRSDNQAVEEDGPTPVQITPQEKTRLQGLLSQAIEDCEECPICFGILSEPRITFCGHMFCLPW